MRKMNQQTRNKINTMAKNLKSVHGNDISALLQCSNDLLTLCMEGIGLGRYVHADGMVSNMDNERYALCYSGDILHRTLKDVWKDYDGSQDFFSLFKCYYRVKAQGLEKDCFDMNGGVVQEIKKDFLHDQLKNMAKEEGIRLGKIDFNLLNKGKLKAVMEKKGFSSKSMDKMFNPNTGYVHQSIVIRDEIVTNDEGEDDNVISMSDTYSYSCYLAKGKAEDGFDYTLRETAAAVKGTAKEAVLKCIITWGVDYAAYDNPDMECVEELIDPEFRTFMAEREDYSKVVDAITEYIGNSRDTIRKDVAKLGKMLRNKASKHGKNHTAS